MKTVLQMIYACLFILNRVRFRWDLYWEKLVCLTILRSWKLHIIGLVLSDPLRPYFFFNLHICVGNLYGICVLVCVGTCTHLPLKCVLCANGLIEYKRNSECIFHLAKSLLTLNFNQHISNGCWHWIYPTHFGKSFRSDEVQHTVATRIEWGSYASGRRCQMRAL